MNTETDVKPCPVCGNRPELFCDPYTGDDVFVVCEKCNIQANGYNQALDAETVVNAWNAIPRDLTWRTTAPTKAGWYWHKNESMPPSVIHIDDSLINNKIWIQEMFEERTNYVAGPIPEPIGD